MKTEEIRRFGNKYFVESLAVNRSLVENGERPIYHMGDIDSLDLVVLAAELEREYGIIIPSKAIDQWGNINDIVRDVEEKIYCKDRIGLKHGEDML